MVFLLNVIFAILGGALAFWVARELTAPRPISVLVAVLAGIVVYLADLAAQVV